MTNADIAAVIADIHNNIVDIKVSGDDTFKMSKAIMLCRNLVSVLNDSKAEDEE